MITVTTLAGLCGFMAMRPCGRAFALAFALLTAAGVPVLVYV